jgi:hypothetical protein
MSQFRHMLYIHGLLHGQIMSHRTGICYLRYMPVAWTYYVTWNRHMLYTIHDHFHVQMLSYRTGICDIFVICYGLLNGKILSHRTDICYIQYMAFCTDKLCHLEQEYVIYITWPVARTNYVT